MQAIIYTLEKLIEKTGKYASWSCSFLVWIIFLDVIMRYLFNRSIIWMVELETYFFAIIILLGGGYAFKHDKHVRVDLYYSQWSDVKKAWVNLLGGLFFLLPWCLISICYCYKYFYNSLRIGETSAQPGGLPALYILKFLLLLGFTLLLLQGIASILKSYQTILYTKGKMNKKQ